MPTPNLIHPVKITLELISREQSMFDVQAREPVRQAIRTGSNPNTGDRITIKGQVMFYYAGGRINEVFYERSGVEERTDGYMACRFLDLRRKNLVSLNDDGSFSIDIKRGDRIIRLARRRVNLYLLDFEDFAFYPRHGQTLIQIDFQDRHPSHQKGDL